MCRRAVAKERGRGGEREEGEAPQGPRRSRGNGAQPRYGAKRRPAGPQSAAGRDRRS